MTDDGTKVSAPDAAYARRRKVLDVAGLAIASAVVFAALVLGMVELSFPVLSVGVLLGVSAAMRCTSAPDIPVYSIADGKLRLGPLRAYPVAAIERVVVKPAANGSTRLVITGQDMARHRTPPLQAGEQLAERLRAANPAIDVVRRPA